MKRETMEGSFLNSSFLKEENNPQNLTHDDFVKIIYEYKKREFGYLSNIASLEREINVLLSSINECKYVNNMHNFDKIQIKDVFFDPTVHIEIKQLRNQLYEKNQTIKKLNEELTAKQFYAQSIMGQKIINKCKKLQEENTELGRLLNIQNENPNLNNFDDQNFHSNILLSNIANLKKYIFFLKNELKQLRELNMDIDADNEDLTKQLAAITTNYSSLKKERDEMENTINELKEQIKIYENKFIEKENKEFKKEKRRDSDRYMSDKIHEHRSEKREKRRSNRQREREREKESSRERERESSREREK